MYLEKDLRVGIVEGERLNFKITTDFDMSLAELLMKNKS
ncbi:MAG: 2-C-methyl-D-erythritol 4-phosphate cytidylyltransferase [Clostridia bacterium]|nr:2-C-methyl-D-erythritol 4-phosphate cytidylyltransferase [Clostridia bacterium]